MHKGHVDSVNTNDSLMIETEAILLSLRLARMLGFEKIVVLKQFTDYCSTTEQPIFVAGLGYMEKLVLETRVLIETFMSFAKYIDPLEPTTRNP